MPPKSPKLILAVSGASGSIYALKLLERLVSLDPRPAEIAVILSDTAREIWRSEIGEEFHTGFPAKEYDNNNFYAPFASGSSSYEKMIICPASMGTLGRIAGGVSDDLITRAADVMLKERRQLILVPREAPYSLIHIKNMELLTLAGAVICPASPSFYSKPLTIDSLVNTVVERVLTLAQIETGTYRWMEND
jgi:4-hydroxy-3-polyprenylbenzoate decarboxylase